MLQIVVQKILANGDVAFLYPRIPIPVADIRSLFIKLPDIIAHLGDQTTNVFYTLYHHHGANHPPKPARSNSTFDYGTVIPFDIDGVQTNRAHEYAEVVASILGCPKEFLTLVSSGNGVHILANLRHPIRDSKFFEENRPYYKTLLDRIEVMLKARELPYKSLDSIMDAGRVFRLPGTINQKPDRPDKACELLHYSDEVLDIDLKVISGWAEIERTNIPPHEVKRNYPKPDIQEMLTGCEFMKWVADKPEEIREPDFFAFASLMATAPEESKYSFQDEQKTAEQITENVFDRAVNSTSIAKSTFTDKWEQAGKYGARKCSSINELSDRCNHCPYQHKIVTPLSIRSEKFIGSEDTGFWIYNAKGQHSHPHYGDLARLLQIEQKIIVTGSTGERLLRFNGVHYEEFPPLELKYWLEEKVKPNDPLKESHRAEFAAKVKASFYISGKRERELFDESIKSKLNCKNGTLNLITGEMLPHSREVGFMNVLPYDYKPGEVSEYFINWLIQVTNNRVELIETLLDFMAYCLWPTYDDHIFMCLLGEGKNGKSTFCRILKTMLGEHNTSSISVKQLVSNRFAPASLEGKMVNISDESSGIELDFEATNTLKTLSAGESFQAERKNQDGFNLTNKAKLIFNANDPPRFSEKSEALRRRLLVVPFDHKIEKIDSRIGERLSGEEVPKILSMLIRRIQEKIKKDGRFIVDRGGQITQEAQTRLLLSGNSVMDWAHDHLVSREEFTQDDFISISHAYEEYKRWTDANGYKSPMNSKNFKITLQDNFLVPSVRGKEVRKRVENEYKRVFVKTKYRREVERETPPQTS